MGGGLIVLLTFAEPVKLLRQEVCRAGVSTGTTADTTFFLYGFAHFRSRRGQQTVGDFHHRNVEPGQSKAHQRAAHNHHLIAGRAESRVAQQVFDRRTETRPDVARQRNRFAGQRYHAFGQRLAVDHCTLHRVGRPDVLHQDANIGRTSTVRHLLTGQNLRQLFRAAGGVFGWNDAQTYAVAACKHCAHH